MFKCTIDDALELRLWDHSHAEALYAAVHQSRAHLRQWLKWVDATKDVDETRRFITRALEQHARGDGFHAGIWLEGHVVGGIGLLYIKRPANRTEIGYWLGEKSQGKGIMTRACRRMIDYLFNDLQLNRVEIRCATDNVRSRAVPQRLGFREEGILRHMELLQDQYVDHAVYGMLRSEWPAAPHAAS